MPRPLVVAAAQTGRVEDGGSAAVLERAHALLEEAGRRGVGLLVFCELFLTPFFANRLEAEHERFFMTAEDPMLASLRAAAKHLRVAVVLPFAERARDGWFNSALVCDERGDVAGCYRKTHIPAYFPSAGEGGTGSYEKMYFAPGAALPVYAVAGTRIGIQICNDRLYPEASRVLALRGAELLAMPISYSTYADPAQRRSIWEVPLRARAYENGVFVLACNRVGSEGVRHHLGRSMLVDPRGMVQAVASDQVEELLVAGIDLDETVRARKQFPWWRDRRPDLYGELAPGAP